MTKGLDVILDVCAYQLRTFDEEISCRLGQRSQPGLIPGREAKRSVRVQFVQGSYVSAIVLVHSLLFKSYQTRGGEGMV